MNPVWLDQYPPGTSNHIEASNESLIDLLKHPCTRCPERVAFSSFGTSLTYRDLDEKSDAFARWLHLRNGLEAGDRVALLLPNLLQYPVAWFGILKAGMVATSINPLYSAREMHYQLNDSGAKLILAFDGSLERLAEALPGTDVEWIVTTSVGDLMMPLKRVIFNAGASLPRLFVRRKFTLSLFKQRCFTEVLKQGADISTRLPEVKASDLAILQYTGGTTGVAKGAMLRHCNLVANLMQIQAFFPLLNDPKGLLVITAIPLFHIFSLTVNCLLFIKIGGTNVLIADGRKIGALVRTLKKFRCHVITGVETLFNALLNRPEFHRLDFSALKLSIGGGMPVHHITARRWSELTGNLILQGYGLTETSPVVCVNPCTETDFNDTVGLPVPGTEISIRSLNDSDEKELSFGEHGELCVRGPQLMAGYWKQTEASAATIDEQGWLKTGDIAYVDEQGYVHIVGRRKNLVLVSGFNVYPSEVEEVLSDYAGVAEVACIGVPDAHSGERVKAFVVETRKGALSEENLLKFCITRLAAYKVPVRVEFRESLPKSSVGKILHRKLR